MAPAVAAWTCVGRNGSIGRHLHQRESITEHDCAPLSACALSAPPWSSASARPAGCGLRRQQHPELRGDRQGEVVGGAQPVSAPRRSHSQSGRDREGLRRAGAAGAGRGHQCARARDPGPGADPARHRHQSGGVQAIPGRAGATHRRARASARGLGELSRPEIEPELSGAAIAARRHREPHRGRAPRLHRGGAAVQHGAAHVPRRDLGLDALQEPASRWRRLRSPRT